MNITVEKAWLGYKSFLTIDPKIWMFGWTKEESIGFLMAALAKRGLITLDEK